MLRSDDNAGAGVADDNDRNRLDDADDDGLDEEEEDGAKLSGSLFVRS